MALSQAIIAGAVAGFGVPMAMKASPPSELADFIASQSIHFMIFDIGIRWSWSIFAVVTLFAWVAFKAARGR